MAEAAAAPLARPRMHVGARALPAAASGASLLLVFAFLISLAAPIETSVFVGQLRLSPYRIVLFLALIPCLYRFAQGHAGHLRLADGLVVLHAIWAFVALLIAHGTAAIEFAGIYAVEALVPYLLARAYIRTAADFVSFAKFMALVILVLAPWGIYEAITHNILRNPPDQPLPRWGLARAYGPFEHPILYGVFCASMFGIVFYALKGQVSRLSRYLRLGAIASGTFFSLSAGPLMALAAQIGLITWNRVLSKIKHRWLLLAAGAVGAWTVVSILSPRTPIHVFISNFTFNRQTGYMRIAIWDYGSAEALRHPWFGIGMGEWTRPAWMAPSVDNFWLLEAMRYGMPALLFLAVALAVLMLQAARTPHADEHVRNCRTGWMVTMFGLILAGATVHYWNATFCLFMFLLGAGSWLNQPTSRIAVPRPALPRYHKAMRARVAPAPAQPATE
jgi:hypothetical protein